MAPWLAVSTAAGKQCGFAVVTPYGRLSCSHCHKIVHGSGRALHCLPMGVEGEKSSADDFQGHGSNNLPLVQKQAL